MLSRFRLLALIAIPLVVFDQATKLHIDYHFALHESRVIIENFFAITYVRNPGAAFGILADSAVRIPFFITVTLVALAAILWYIARLDVSHRLSLIALSLIFGGAVGNLIDRIRLGEVIDFLDVHWYERHWPAFNIADAAITIGVILLLWDAWQQERRAKRASGRT